MEKDDVGRAKVSQVKGQGEWLWWATDYTGIDLIQRARDGGA